MVIVLKLIVSSCFLKSTSQSQLSIDDDGGEDDDGDSERSVLCLFYNLMMMMMKVTLKAQFDVCFTFYSMFHELFKKQNKKHSCGHGGIVYELRVTHWTLIVYSMLSYACCEGTAQL